MNRQGRANTTPPKGRQLQPEADFDEMERSELWRSVIRPRGQQKKVIEKIEITEFEQKDDFTKFRVLTRFIGFNNDVFRRYSDFYRLHSFLLHTYCSYTTDKVSVVMLPKLPEKHSLQDQLKDYDEQSRIQFSEQRKEDLEIYLNMLAEIDQIRNNEHFKEFLNNRELENFNKHVENLNIVVPITKPEKVLYAVKTTFNSLYKYWEQWKMPPVDVPETIATKLNRISKVRSTLADLLDNERLRIRCINIQNQELRKAVSPNEAPSNLLSSFRKRIGSIPQKSQSTKYELEGVLGQLSDMFEEKLREDLKTLQKIPDIKKDIKIAMAACDAALSQFSHICNLRPAHLNKLLAQFEQLLDHETLFAKAQKALVRYCQYYRGITSPIQF